TKTIEVGEDEYILDAAQSEGLDMPFSCLTGSCTECVGKMKEGEVDQSKAMGIDPMQKDEGYVLTCVATPESDCKLEADVQEELFELDMEAI
ncbi:MAG: 2Fe-2S iron-sulfur cluster-binding protein, partial [Halobacteria archaeon]|nr:2Fe-2S iron-sulfur cluster-binding protein [Halobacteria archaeon]